MKSFSDLYESWILTKRKDTELQGELARRYRAVWGQGDPVARRYVLDFVFETMDAAGFDLMLEGMQEQDPGLAGNAAIMTSILLSRGVDLGDEVKMAFEDFNRRFPHRAFPERPN